MIMSKSINLIPSVIQKGFVLEIIQPIFNLQVNSFIYIYNTDYKNAYGITEDLRLMIFDKKNFQNYPYIKFLQYVDMKYNYNPIQFNYDKNSAFFKLLFVKIRREFNLN